LILTAELGFAGACASNPLAWIGACIPLAIAYYHTIGKINPRKARRNTGAICEEAQ